MSERAEPGAHAGESRAQWAHSLAAELQYLDRRHAAALVQVYARRLPIEEAARALGVTVEEFGTVLGDAMSSLGRRICAPTLAGPAPA